MANDKSINAKVSKYVVTYDRILKLIQDGVYPINSKLPSEAELSNLMEVSRTTLRQALLLLEEDGFIKMKHGSGSYVCGKPSNEVGLEHKTNPVYKCYTGEIDEVQVEHRIGVSNNYTKHILERDVPIVVAVNRYYKAKSITCVYGFSCIPSDTLQEYNIDLEDKKALLSFLEKELYEVSKSITLEIKFVKESELIKLYNINSEEGIYVLLLEQVYDKKGQVILNNKYFIPIESAKLIINAHDSR